MNREIKFRAWFNGRMIYSHNNTINHDFQQLEWFFKIINLGAVIMQYTGVKDNNGKEVYEGDILGKCFDDYDENCVVVYDGAICCAQPIGKNKFRPLCTNEHKGSCGWVEIDNKHSYDFKVIGNLYEPSELLNED